ncbi:DUF3108 domain-containing protein [Ferrimonas balearica]|uniref:DUF3108 domain-containing protein n=1 Tax=Ferrimonas balearica TaxID=44012 RepID=UPI001F26CE09|nr:DUF3108 domain-containing protein [Ferrimonas balearica]MBY6018358.1 DUF3108 domain-containing protein [Halomonas denitrificans]MBY6094708.1 DUF3108 domain-containing protein [Ferrimonas balearica]
MSRRFLLLCLFSPLLHATPVPFEAHYRAYTTGLPCGKGQFSLEQQDNGEYRYQASGKICVIGQHIDHLSQFQHIEGELKPGNYHTEFDGWFTHRTLNGSLNDEGRYVVVQNGETLPDSEAFPRAQWEPAQMLRLLGEARDDITLSYTWGDETREYRFDYLGTETLETELGPLLTHKFEQDHPNEARVATFWFAPELDDLLVKLESSRLGVHWLTVEIKRYQTKG